MVHLVQVVDLGYFGFNIAFLGHKMVLVFSDNAKLKDLYRVTSNANKPFMANISEKWGIQSN